MSTKAQEEARRAEVKRKGLCAHCRKVPAAPRRVTCETCGRRNRDRMRKARGGNK